MNENIFKNPFLSLCLLGERICFEFANGSLDIKLDCLSYFYSNISNPFWIEKFFNDRFIHSLIESLESSNIDVSLSSLGLLEIICQEKENTQRIDALG